MKKNKTIELNGKFIVAYDTLCDGWNCMVNIRENGVESPTLFNSEDEAFKEIFDGNLCMLKSHRNDEMLEELNEGVTPEMIDEMEKVFDTNDVSLMRKFMSDNPDCNDSGEWVEPAETFIMNRKTFLTSEGIVITGTKLIMKDDEQ